MYSSLKICLDEMGGLSQCLHKVQMVEVNTHSLIQHNLKRLQCVCYKAVGVMMFSGSSTLQTQVIGPEHLRLDTVLLYTEGRAATLQYKQQGKNPFS